MRGSFIGAAFLLTGCVGFSVANAETSVTTIATDMEASGGVAISQDGHIHVGDFGSALNTAGGKNVYRIDAGTGEISILTNEFSGGASGNAFGADGNLYQSDVGAGEAYRITMEGERTRLAAGMATPVGIAPGDDGTVYVTNCVTSQILRIVEGEKTEVVAKDAPLNCPNGLTFGGDGALYSVNFRDGGMTRIDPETGEAELFAQIPGGGNGHLEWANDRFYVASFYGGKIYSVSMDGELCHIAGSGEKGNEDGDGLSASFFRPNGVAISADGDSLYTNTVLGIVDRADPSLHLNAVRRVDGLLSMLNCPADRVIASPNADK